MFHKSFPHDLPSHNWTRTWLTACSVASKRNWHCGGKARSKSEGINLVGFFLGRGDIAVSALPPARGSGERCISSPSGVPRPARVFVHFGFFRWALLQSCYAKLCNQLTNLAYFCGGEKILSPLQFQHCGGERPRCPHGSERLCACS